MIWELRVIHHDQSAACVAGKEKALNIKLELRFFPLC